MTEASVNTAAVQVAMAAVELAKLVSAQQQAAPPACGHQAPQQAQFNTRKWLTISGLAIVGGCVACFLAMAFAVAAVAVAICATCATACLIVLRSMWRDLTNR